MLVQIGEPINVSAYLREHASLSQPEVMNLMKDDLSERMKEVILYIPDDEHYDATLETCAAVINQQVDTWRKEHPGARRHALTMDTWRKEHPGSRRHSLTTRFAANKMTLGQIARLRAAEPEKAAELLGRADEIHREREKRGISLGSVVKKHPFWSRLLQLLVLIVTLPYTIPAGVLTLPVTGLSAFLFSKMKDRAFYNSIPCCSSSTPLSCTAPSRGNGPWVCPSPSYPPPSCARKPGDCCGWPYPTCGCSAPRSSAAPSGTCVNSLRTFCTKKRSQHDPPNTARRTRRLHRQPGSRAARHPGRVRTRAAAVNGGGSRPARG